jgi:hypothetical protein
LITDGKTTNVTKGKLIDKKAQYRGGKQLWICQVEDEAKNRLEISFFSAFGAKNLVVGLSYLIIGKAKNFR